MMNHGWARSAPQALGCPQGPSVPPEWTTRAAAYPVRNLLRGGMNVPTEPLPTPARRVVLVDVRDERRQLMRLVVEGDPTKAVLVGESASRAAALAMVEQQHADVVIVDVQMPLPEGLATVVALRERYPKLGIVVCSFDLDRATSQRVLALGADSWLLKPVGRADVHTALSGLPYHASPPLTALREPAPAC
jgi:CheY-like chemotaxis protein